MSLLETIFSNSLVFITSARTHERVHPASRLFLVVTLSWKFDAVFVIFMRRRRKSRTAFSTDQLNELEKRFQVQRYLTPIDRDNLAGKLGLRSAQVITDIFLEFAPLFSCKLLIRVSTDFEGGFFGDVNSLFKLFQFLFSFSFFLSHFFSTFSRFFPFFLKISVPGSKIGEPK